jgi:hypothetical protein
MFQGVEHLSSKHEFKTPRVPKKKKKSSEIHPFTLSKEQVVFISSPA